MARRKAKAVAGGQGAKGRKRKAQQRADKNASRARAAVIEMAAASSEMPEGGALDALVLPDALDGSSAAAVKELLIARRGNPLVVDAGQVRRVGVQAIQVLIAAAQSWQADGQSYVVANASSEFLDTIALVGLSREHLFLEGMA